MTYSDSTCASQWGGESIFSKAEVWWKELLMLDQTDPDTKNIPEGEASAPYPESAAPSTGSGIRSQLNK